MPSFKKGALLFVLLIGLLVLFFLYMYWFRFLPLQEQIDSLQIDLKNEEKQIAKLEQHEETNHDVLANQTVKLQTQLPVAPLLDQFILDLEKAETSSGSLITSYTFLEENTENEDLVTEYENMLKANGSSEDDGSSTQAETEDRKDESNENKTNLSIPEGIEKLTVNMIVEAPSYFELEAFIKAIEELPRITKIDQLTFYGNNEVRTVETTINKLAYNITVSTYYYPKLEELKNQLPKYEKPPSANKINPLYPTGKYDKSETKDKEEPAKAGSPKDELSSKTIEKNGKLYQVYLYEVQTGDTLYSLSLAFYRNREGEQIIKEWNGLNGLLAGTKIEIPILVQGQ